jgi:ATP-dependent DNA helicase RecG
METDEQCTYFLTVLKVNDDFIRLINGNQEGANVSGKESVKVSDQVSDQVSDEVKVVLTYCKSPKSRKEILAKIELANHTTNFKRHIVPLLEKQWLKMTIAENPKHRNQKYITTESGEKMLVK